MFIITKKGQAHSPRPGNQRNDLSWEAVVATLEANPASAAELIEAIKEGNPENQGNAIGYVKYAERQGWIELAE